LDETAETRRSEARRVRLDEHATILGTRWACACRAELGREGRLATGGWPGTVGEARNRVARELGALLAKRRLPALTHGELEDASRLAYKTARRDWIANAAVAAAD
jgi:hypothetical protein